MTIKELCIKYNCNITSMYNKIKRKEYELSGHIYRENGVIHIDEYAEEILKPAERQKEIKALIEKGKTADWEMEMVKVKLDIEISKRREADEKVESLIKANDELKQALDAVNREKENLYIEVSELKHRIEELEMKPKGIFMRR